MTTEEERRIRRNLVTPGKYPPRTDKEKIYKYANDEFVFPFANEMLANVEGKSCPFLTSMMCFGTSLSKKRGEDVRTKKEKQAGKQSKLSLAGNKRLRRRRRGKKSPPLPTNRTNRQGREKFSPPPLSKVVVVSPPFSPPPLSFPPPYDFFATRSIIRQNACFFP